MATVRGDGPFEQRRADSDALEQRLSATDIVQSYDKKSSPVILCLLLGKGFY
jgi:hypothetical protein